MTIDLELTLNRFRFERVAANKLQLGPVRLSWWRGTGKHSVSLEVNWKTMNTRDERQQRVYEWVRTTFGLANQDAHERALRFFEEAVELAQAEGVPENELVRIVQHVCAKPAGRPEQEAGGAGTTLLAYCASKGFSADDAERREFERVLTIPAEHFRQRHRVKSDAGIALPCSDDP